MAPVVEDRREQYSSQEDGADVSGAGHIAAMS